MIPAMPCRLHYASATDSGRERRENQDRFLVREDLQLAAVADGMGGMPHGGEAAQLAIDSLDTLARQPLPEELAGWRTLLETLNRTVFELGLKLSPSQGIGTTVTIARAQDSRLLLAHVGDSAALRLRDGELEQLTTEHTVAAEILARRAQGSPARLPRGAGHTLTSCLGLPYLPNVDVHEADLRPGDRLLLCSDGLTKPVAPAQLAAALARADSPASAAAALVALANSAGGPDNITVVVAFAAAS
ncbi:MAG: serine/threonine-protein phosphatase [Opitutaceae bacterium]